MKKYRILRNIFATITAIAFILILGTVGGLETDTLTFGQFFTYLAGFAILLAVSFYITVKFDAKLNYMHLKARNAKELNYEYPE